METNSESHKTKRNACTNNLINGTLKNINSYEDRLQMHDEAILCFKHYVT